VSGWTADEVTARALQVVDDWRGTASPDDGRPWFLVVHWAPPPADEEVARSASGEDATIAQAGTALAALRRGLEERDALGGAVVALTAGHGSERREHGGTGAGWTLHEEVIRVPLVVRGLGAGATGTVDTPVSTLALGETLRGLAARDADGVAAEERRELAIAALPVAGASGEARGALVISELVVRERALVRAVVDGDIKYLQILREVPPGDRAVVARGYEELQAAMTSGRIATPPLFGDPMRELLVRVATEGVAETELALADHRQELSRLRAALRDYQRRCEEDGWAPPLITERLPVDLEDVESLEMLGYM
jgi:hypothetical protein